MRPQEEELNQGDQNPEKPLHCFIDSKQYNYKKRQRHQIFHCDVMTFHSERNNDHAIADHARLNGRLCTVH